MYSNLHFSNFLKITGNKAKAYILRISAKAKKQIFLISLILIVLTNAATIKSYGQNALELGQALSSMKASTDANIQTQGVHIESLIYKLQPKLYINNGIEKFFDEVSPVCAEIDALSISKLNETNPLFNQVELLTIKLNSINDLNFVIDFSTLQSFSQLKYVYFLCNFNCSPEQINKLFVQNSNTGIAVYYNISIEN